MKKLYYISSLILLSCATTKDLTTVSFKTYDNLTKKNYSYKVSIPNGFTIKEIESGNEWREKRCQYSDNLIFYINDENSIPSINYKNIEADKDNMTKYLTSKNDTLTIWGIDKQGRYWKNKKWKNINLGYLNVPKERRNEFDKAISTLR